MATFPGTPCLPRRIYLASKSPRRRELLLQIGICFDALPFAHEAGVDETPLPHEPADQYVLRLAKEKALYGQKVVDAQKLPLYPVLAADTVLELEGEIIGKPADADEAWRILNRLSGRVHRVLTGVALAFENRVETALNLSTVHFRKLEEEEIRRYVASGEPMDKAGAYGVQGRASMFITHISGSYSGIMGLPLYETCQLLSAFHYDFA